jgi:hypothetical protein
MQDFPPNSQKAKATEAPREKLKPVTSAETVRRKRGLGRKFKETFFGGTAKDAASLTVTDVLVPEIRDLMHNAILNILEYVFYGDRARPRRGGGILPNQNMGRVAYDSISKPTRASQQTTRISRKARARHDFDDLIIPTRQEAEEVLDQMFEILSRDGDVSVANLYELTGVRSEFTDTKWGWHNLRGAKAVRLRNGGFLLDLPEPEALG